MNTTVDQKRIIGENIKAARKIKGLSQRALAEKLGIAFQNLSVWENGKGAPSAKYLMKLAEILSISLDQLTSKSGFIASLERGSMERAGYGAYTGGGEYGQADSALQRALQNEIPKIVQRELSDNHTLKLIIAYLEEILGILRHGSQVRPELRQAADSQGHRTYSPAALQIPLPPVDLAKEKRKSWERNAATLLKWSESDQSFWVPAWALEKYCRTVEPSPYGENLGEVSKALKDYVEQGAR
ncbi:MAG: hypothetical protein A3F83_05560 [Candidatus Glassbacteria bacterium RIFCSPLOWO2_12_FULL_58_11]|uniref:HTH cro/C1-type domain-containing protein n=1 Tax=Candidatus Glassbacteria bacterium RIFCSPLOWO2_12_FULL_58_11 TaxID=1817867 RepID=A0A1F5YSE6_9BACT|nr:MAG: hypothetical protein A3F83_05560 [Candidatus Glassbacteria bacterium RIFCSPLOWO2_12_FULL_58_11]